MGMLRFSDDRELKEQYQKLKDGGATNFRIFPHRDGSKSLLFKPAPTDSGRSLGDMVNPLDK